MAQIGNYPRHHHGTKPQPTCPHTYLDASNECLDCGLYVPGTGGPELCIYCCTEPVSDESDPYCSAACAAEAQADGLGPGN